MLLQLVNAGDLREFLLAYVELVDAVAVAKFNQMEAESFVNAARDTAAAQLEKMESSEYKNRIAAEKKLVENDAYIKGVAALAIGDRNLASAEIDLRGADKVMMFLQAAMNQGDVNVFELVKQTGLKKKEEVSEEKTVNASDEEDAEPVRF
jgi:hypothetical protein